MEVLESIENLDILEKENDPKFSVPLKECVDLEELMKPDSKGCVFEVDEDQMPPDLRGDNNFFDNEDIFQNLNNACLKRGDDDDSSGDELLTFEKLGQKMEDISGDNGIKKKIVKHGMGNVVPSGVTVKIHYNGFLELSDEPYDSSRLRCQPQRFRLGAGEILPGIDIAVSTMRKGELSNFLVKSEYAFGKKGVPPRIPEDATILYEIELLFYSDDAFSEEFDSMTDEKKKATSFSELLQVINNHRMAGNDLFKMNAFSKASSRYQKAFRILENAHLKNEEEEKQMKAVMLKVCLNMSLCSFKVGNSPRAVTFANKALDVDARNAKAHFRKGQALLHLSDFSRARGCLKTAQRLAPNDSSIVKELQKLDKAYKNFTSLERDMYSKMFSRTGTSGTKVSKRPDNTCSKDFQEQVTKSLRTFEEDDASKKAFPMSKLCESEKEFIMTTAESFGFQARIAEETTGNEIISVTKQSKD